MRPMNVDVRLYCNSFATTNSAMSSPTQFQAVMPPSITNTCPVTYEDSLDARYNAAKLISSG